MQLASYERHAQYYANEVCNTCARYASFIVVVKGVLPARTFDASTDDDDGDDNNDKNNNGCSDSSGDPRYGQ